MMFFFSSRRRHTRWNCDWSSDVCSSDLTPPASVLCRISGETIFRTTGKPMPAASFAASAAEVATPSLGTAMPYASHTSLPSGAVSEVRPSALTLSRMRRTSVLLFAMVISLNIERGGATLAPPTACARDWPSDYLFGAQRRDLVLVIAE